MKRRSMPKEREKWQQSKNHNFSRKRKQRGNPNCPVPELIAQFCGAALCDYSHCESEYCQNSCRVDFVVSHPFHKEREMDGARSFLTPSVKMHWCRHCEIVDAGVWHHGSMKASECHTVDWQAIWMRDPCKRRR